ncbi:MAG: NADH-quinone oxidoreductase subunit NuoH [Candidatus Aquicultor secundus]|uniref:NADH-quinone oxidoreductase subunit H n=1 Tax=Candidatus Aquicultor secundus TaxID=1973895 RepID=A0A2M7T8V3_9ACTN|nr:NADH-quinone oxidoreductase subunit NuoH [Candidatus Aquicultor secundus]NCO65074.1 NADH-quinone oxidoreductase subunit NuoH [Solirubrobacter sp.]PIU27317.1 MAG: NADH-quinone oxidoreductase subunit NuoH [Candidatus Aquicultor secundus]PIW21886.1 MAG: NADH-quinone oxidoreductase subunit NuoH [Candidatus Aquicultor secundus]PIX52007.1 MAG: NADH-quinone oxidoreductase subunit NuoH [Candidatus Aquicultor secundus]PIY39641.1 MAG: NADH-quinone oxidoreductase subunit NuoH [Candidatus Aquicultor se
MLSSTKLLEFASNYGIPVWALDGAIAIVFAVVLFAICAISVIINVYLLRKISADFQLRYGPMHVGWHGSLQLFADAIKLLTKEDIFPSNADRWIFRLAPVVTFVPAYLGFLVLPIGHGIVIQDLNVGLLYILAIPAIGVAGIIMAGFGSYNKYAIIGSLRSAAQMVSYEVPRALSIIGIVMIAGSAKLSSIVGAQHVWYIILQPIAFVVFLVSTLAEINSTPFDLPETESELVNGYYTEYSGMRFMFFFFAEYVALFAAATLTTVLFLGGWHGPGPEYLGPIWFTIKTFAMIWVIMWIKWTLPRFRIDQVMDLGWKVLLPLALINVLITGLVMMII